MEVARQWAVQRPKTHLSHRDFLGQPEEIDETTPKARFTVSPRTEKYKKVHFSQRKSSGACDCGRSDADFFGATKVGVLLPPWLGGSQPTESTNTARGGQEVTIPLTLGIWEAGCVVILRAPQAPALHENWTKKVQNVLETCMVHSGYHSESTGSTGILYYFTCHYRMLLFKWVLKFT